MKPFVAISFGAVGDFLLTLPLLRVLRERGPLALLARGSYRALLPDWLTDAPFLAIDGATGTRLFSSGATFPRALSHAVADAEIHVFSRPDGVLAGNLERHGAARIVWHDPRPASPPHVVARFFANADISLPEDWAHQPSMPVETPGNALWIHAGSGSASKTLPLPFLAFQAQRWHEEASRPVIVSFGEADLARREPLRKAFTECGVVYDEVVCPSLAELRARLARDTRLFLGADTGVTHLAAALGKDVLVGFRTTDPAIWRPLGHCRVLSPSELEREPHPHRGVPKTKDCAVTGQQPRV